MRVRLMRSLPRCRLTSGAISSGPAYRSLGQRAALIIPESKQGCGQPDIYRLAASLSRFRNRVMHHEPIHRGFDLRVVEADAPT